MCPYSSAITNSFYCLVSYFEIFDPSYHEIKSSVLCANTSPDIVDPAKYMPGDGGGSSLMDTWLAVGALALALLELSFPML